MSGWPLTFLIDAAPVGKGRPRYSAPRDGDKRIVGVKVVEGRVNLIERSAGPRIFTPKVTARAEKVVWALAISARNKAGLTQIPSDTAVFVEITAGMRIPPSWPKKDRDAALAGTKVPMGVPDLDNIIKLVLDGINRVLFMDDRQVSQISAKKVFSDTPFVHVTVGPIPPKEEK